MESHTAPSMDIDPDQAHAALSAFNKHQGERSLSSNDLDEDGFNWHAFVEATAATKNSQASKRPSTDHPASMQSMLELALRKSTKKASKEVKKLFGTMQEKYPHLVGLESAFSSLSNQEDDELLNRAKVQSATFDDRDEDMDTIFLHLDTDSKDKSAVDEQAEADLRSTVFAKDQMNERARIRAQHTVYAKYDAVCIHCL